MISSPYLATFLFYKPFWVGKSHFQARPVSLQLLRPSQGAMWKLASLVPSSRTDLTHPRAAEADTKLCELASNFFILLSAAF